MSSCGYRVHLVGRTTPAHRSAVHTTPSGSPAGRPWATTSAGMRRPTACGQRIGRLETARPSREDCLIARDSWTGWSHLVGLHFRCLPLAPQQIAADSSPGRGLIRLPHARGVVAFGRFPSIRDECAPWLRHTVHDTGNGRETDVVNGVSHRIPGEPPLRPPPTGAGRWMFFSARAFRRSMWKSKIFVEGMISQPRSSRSGTFSRMRAA